MSDTARQPVLLALAAEAIVPALPGCAEVLRGGVTTAGLVERGLSLFGSRITDCWYNWSRGQSNDSRRAALNDLAALSQDEARRGAFDALSCLAPDARSQDRVAAAAYLAAIPRTLDQIWRDHDPTSPWSPGTVSWEQPNDLLRALPVDAPPYSAPCDLPGTPYRLEQLLGAGGFGAVYRAAAPALQHLPFAVKFCLDPTLAPALHLERSNLERLMQAGREPAAQRIVRLYGYDFTHPTPYLVYEYVSGGDLDRHVRGRRRLHGRRLSPTEIFGIIQQIAEGLAFAHRHGLVHRDLKPANILFDGKLFKLADFGIGGVAMVRVARGGEMGAVALDAEGETEVTRFRAAGTPLYMSPEQREGAPPDRRHDLYSLGVMWHQLLADDFRRALQHGWAKDLASRYEAPRHHLKLIERCVGRFDERPKDAGELHDLLSTLVEEKVVLPPPLPPEPPLEVIPIRRKAAPPPLPEDGPLLDRLTGVMRHRREDAPRTPTHARIEVSPERRSEYIDLLRRLSQAHAEATHSSALPGYYWMSAAGFIGAGSLGWFTDEAYYTLKHPQYGFFNLAGGAIDVGAIISGVLVAVAVGAASLLTLQQIHRSRQRQAHVAVAEAVRRLVDQFREEVREWGGVTMLYDAEQVARVLRSMESEAAS